MGTNEQTVPLANYSALLSDAVKLRDELEKQSDSYAKELAEFDRKLCRAEADLTEKDATIEEIWSELDSAREAQRDAWCEVGRLCMVSKLALEDAHAAKARIADRDAKLLSIKMVVDGIGGLSEFEERLALRIKTILEER